MKKYIALEMIFPDDIEDELEFINELLSAIESRQIYVFYKDKNRLMTSCLINSIFTRKWEHIDEPTGEKLNIE